MPDDETVIMSGQWLNDRIIDAVNRIVTSHLGILENQSTLLAQSPAGFDALTSEGIMILHDVDHWITTACIGVEVLYVDSLGRGPSEIVKTQMRQLFARRLTEAGRLRVTLLPCARQTNCRLRSLCGGVCLRVSDEWGGRK